MLKRVFDLLVSATLVILLIPVFAIICLGNIFTLGRPLFFLQERPGLHGRSFRMIKFRTMTNEKDQYGRLLDNELRMTKTGNFLRSTSLDELPGLINVIRGEMSLVGPRPLLTEYLPYYSVRQKKRHDVRPGITGWAQINGRNAISWDKKLELDVWYVENQSFFLDLIILLKTVIKVLRREGIKQKGYISMPRFDDYIKSKQLTS